MQKALDQMNLQLHQVISDITGQTGMAIVEAILAGERDPRTLAGCGMSASRPVRRWSPNRWWGTFGRNTCLPCGNPSPLIVAIKSWSRIAIRKFVVAWSRCRRRIRPTPSTPTLLRPQSQPQPPSHQSLLYFQLKRIFGIDLTKIPGIRVRSAQTLFGEVGPDFSKFRSASAFTIWMGLCPDNDISGGKVLWVCTLLQPQLAS
jgi:transposase